MPLSAAFWIAPILGYLGAGIVSLVLSVEACSLFSIDGSCSFYVFSQNPLLRRAFRASLTLRRLPFALFALPCSLQSTKFSCGRLSGKPRRSQTNHEKQTFDGALSPSNQDDSTSAAASKKYEALSADWLQRKPCVSCFQANSNGAKKPHIWIHRPNRRIWLGGRDRTGR